MEIYTEFEWSRLNWNEKNDDVSLETIDMYVMNPNFTMKNLENWRLFLLKNYEDRSSRSV